MAGNFKILFFILLIFSCKNNQDTDERTAVKILNQNFEILMSSVSYFDLSSISENNNITSVNLNNEVMTMDLEESKEKFKNRFRLKQNKIDPIFFKIKSIPSNKIYNFPIKLVSFKEKTDDNINVSFTNFLIDSSCQYSSITVIQSRGIGARFEIYYFKYINDKWVFDGKELLALG